MRHTVNPVSTSSDEDNNEEYFSPYRRDRDESSLAYDGEPFLRALQSSPGTELTTVIDVNSQSNQRIAIEVMSPILSLFTNLLELDLSYQMITRIENIASLTKLKRLNLTCNRIEEFSNLENLVELETLDLSKNEIVFIPPAIAYNSKLNNLNLGYNRLDDLESLHNLAPLQLLVTLTLQGNQIEKHKLYYETICSTLPKLSILDSKYTKDITSKLQTLSLMGSKVSEEDLPQQQSSSHPLQRSQQANSKNTLFSLSASLTCLYTNLSQFGGRVQTSILDKKNDELLECLDKNLGPSSDLLESFRISANKFDREQKDIEQILQNLEQELHKFVNQEGKDGYPADTYLAYLESIVEYVNHLVMTIQSCRSLRQYQEKHLIDANRLEDYTKELDNLKNLLQAKETMEDRLISSFPPQKDIDNEYFVRVCNTVKLLSESMFFLENSINSMTTLFDLLLKNEQVAPEILSAYLSQPEDRELLHYDEDLLGLNDPVPLPLMSQTGCSVLSPNETILKIPKESTSHFGREKCLDYFRNATSGELVNIIAMMTQVLSLKQQGKSVDELKGMDLGCLETLREKLNGRDSLGIHENNDNNLHELSYDMSLITAGSHQHIKEIGGGNNGNVKQNCSTCETYRKIVENYEKEVNSSKIEISFLDRKVGMLNEFINRLKAQHKLDMLKLRGELEESSIVKPDTIQKIQDQLKRTESQCYTVLSQIKKNLAENTSEKDSWLLQAQSTMLEELVLERRSLYQKNLESVTVASSSGPQDCQSAGIRPTVGIIYEPAALPRPASLTQFKLHNSVYPSQRDHSKPQALFLPKSTILQDESHSKSSLLKPDTTLKCSSATLKHKNVAENRSASTILRRIAEEICEKEKANENIVPLRGIYKKISYLKKNGAKVFGENVAPNEKNAEQHAVSTTLGTDKSSSSARRPSGLNDFGQHSSLLNSNRKHHNNSTRKEIATARKALDTCSLFKKTAREKVCVSDTKDKDGPFFKQREGSRNFELYMQLKDQNFDLESPYHPQNVHSLSTGANLMAKGASQSSIKSIKR